jgi:hypothetical protein
VRGALGEGHVLFSQGHGEPGLATMLGWRDARSCPVLLPPGPARPTGMPGARGLMAGFMFRRPHLWDHAGDLMMTRGAAPGQRSPDRRYQAPGPSQASACRSRAPPGGAWHGWCWPHQGAATLLPVVVV